jgi:hypothetical protein
MTKGRPPHRTLGEARTIAARQGQLCENTKGRGLLYDFAIHLALLIVYVRVKRTKFELRTIEEIAEMCGPDIGKLRSVPATPGLACELWVRAPNGTWRFFIVTRERIAEIPPGPRPDNGCGQPIRENAPGPDQSTVAGAMPVLRDRFVCPFTIPGPSSEG